MIKMNTKILIVDDESTARYAMRKALKVTNADIKEAVDGREALQLVPKLLPDIVLCDINMPVLNGLEFLKEVADLELSKDIILILNLQNPRNWSMQWG